jgi:hypothetical protein
MQIHLARTFPAKQAESRRYKLGFFTEKIPDFFALTLTPKNAKSRSE